MGYLMNKLWANEISRDFSLRWVSDGYPILHSILQWRHNGHNSVSNHQPHDCLLNRLFRRRSQKTSKLRVTGLCAGNSPGTGEFPAQMASYAEMFPFDDVIMTPGTPIGNGKGWVTVLIHVCWWPGEESVLDLVPHWRISNENLCQHILATLH